MKITQLTPFLEAERQKTDHSLIAVRDKNDESLTEARGQTERQTDTFVKEERIEGDQKTSTSRVEADTHRDIERETLEHDVKAERKRSDVRLREERGRADRAIERERSRVNAAINQERDSRNALVSRIFEKEREQTDKNVLAERTRTDSEAHRASSLLTNEIDAHSKTKFSLTTRDEFLAIVSHDLRNPIGAISSCAEMLLEDFAFETTNSEIKPWIDLIQRSADTALRLIGDILDMERIAEGKLQLQLEQHSIDKILRESLESFVHEASAKNVLLRAMPSNIYGDVTCDRDRIMQVLSNLIGNALKFTHELGSVVLSASLGETEVQFSVSDTGPGIPEDKKDRIFDRYAQLGSKDRRGLGLGLYISKMFIEAHEGRLWVQSKVGEGSTFYFVIPRRSSLEKCTQMV